MKRVLIVTAMKYHNGDSRERLALSTAEETGNPDFLIKRIDQLKNLVPAFYEEVRKLGLKR